MKEPWCVPNVSLPKRRVHQAFIQTDYAVALSKFSHLSTLDLCASVNHFREESTGPSLIFAHELYEHPDSHAQVTPAELLLLHERATLSLSQKCSRLRHVYWSALRPTSHGDITIWLWRIFGEEDLNVLHAVPGSAVCEAVGVRDNSWELTYTAMKPWKSLRPFVVDNQTR